MPSQIGETLKHNAAFILGAIAISYLVYVRYVNTCEENEMKKPSKQDDTRDKLEKIGPVTWQICDF